MITLELTMSEEIYNKHFCNSSNDKWLQIGAEYYVLFLRKIYCIRRSSNSTVLGTQKKPYY